MSYRELLRQAEKMMDSANKYRLLTIKLAAKLYNVNSKDVIFTDGTFVDSSIDTIKLEAKKLKNAKKKPNKKLV